MLKFKQYLDEVKKPTGALKKACWKGYTAIGTKQKNGRTVPNCVPEEVEQVNEIDKETVKRYLDKVTTDQLKKTGYQPDMYGKLVPKRQKGVDNAFKRLQVKPTTEELEELFDILEEVVDGIAEESNIDPDILWENLEDVSDEELYETAAWRRKEGKSPTGGLNAKGIASYRRENPGSKLKKAVTGKVKPGSKAAKRRKSFCARMGGMPGPMKKPDGKPTRKALALRKWKCR